MINYVELKAAMEGAGFEVSDGDQWTRKDEANYRQYCYHVHNNMVPNKELMALAYPGIAPEGFPGTGEDPGPSPVAELVEIVIAGDSTVDATESIQLTATGTYDDESTEDVTAEVSWSSSDPVTATVDGGLVTGVAEGVVEITATLDDVTSNVFEITVTDSAVSLAISGASTVAVEGTIELTATVTTKSGDSVDVTGEAVWTSSDDLVATVVGGLVSGEAAGTADITASINGLEDTHEVQVTEE